MKARPPWSLLLVQGSVYRMSYQNWGPQDITPPPKSELPEVPVERGMVLEDVQSGWVGAVTRVEKSGGMHVVALRTGAASRVPSGLATGSSWRACPSG